MPYQVVECKEPWQRDASDELLAFQASVQHFRHDNGSRWLKAGKAIRLLVVRDGVVAGSLDLVSDSPELGLPIEKSYPHEISQLRASGIGLPEVCQVVTDYLRPVEWHSLLMEVARRLSDWPGNIAVCGVPPKQVPIYRIYMGWVVEALPKPRSHHGVVLMTLTREGFKGSVLGRKLQRQSAR
ncbi:MAG: hypothetical protein WCI73_13725 [Phycisphaerae bacterium]